MSDNAKVTFENNTATGSGGAIALHGLATTKYLCSENGALSFINNSRNDGGAINNGGNIAIFKMTPSPLKTTRQRGSHAPTQA
ncbi:MAG: hypothetical protein ACLRPT_01300 [Akkermansia muciniphila]